MGSAARAGWDFRWPIAAGGAHVDCVGTTVSGKPKISAGAKVACGT